MTPLPQQSMAQHSAVDHRASGEVPVSLRRTAGSLVGALQAVIRGLGSAIGSPVAQEAPLHPWRIWRWFS